MSDDVPIMLGPSTTITSPSFSGNNNATAGPSRQPPPSMTAGSIDLTADSDDEGNDNGNGATKRGATSSSSQAARAHPPFPSTTPNHHPSLGAGSSSTSSSLLPPTSKPPDGEIEVIGARINPHPSPRSAFSSHAPAPSVLQPSPRPYPHHNGMPTNTSNGWTSSVPPPPVPPSLPPTFAPVAGPSTSSSAGIRNSEGVSASSAIDLTSRHIPSPPPVPNDKKPVCIGALNSRAAMIYPSPAAEIGGMPPPGSKERYDVVSYLGAEMIKVKLKYKQAGSVLRKDTGIPQICQRDCIAVVTPGLTAHIGELDGALADVLMPHLARGILRLEGFVQRLQPDAPHKFEVRVNVLLFTLPSNINYLEGLLRGLNLYLLDPIPPYDPARHADHPPYYNAHGSGERALQLFHEAQRQHQMWQNRALGGGMGGSGYALNQGQMDKAKQIEVQRKQVDEVFKSLDNGSELDHSDPGPYIKTVLFDHQRKALTFLLQREQDWSALKRARKYAQKRDEKRRRKSGQSALSENGKDGDEEDKGKPKDESRSLWEAKTDDKGRVRAWRNKVTNEEVKGKKGDKPKEGKGAILADDMGLGKTLSIVSLIAATRRSAVKWSKTKIDDAELDSDREDEKSKIKASEIKTKVFGMPTPDSDDDAESSKGGKGRKRKRDDKVPKRSKVCRWSKATLLVCPMSTITNWEDQIKEHWDGQVEIVGGAAGIMPPKTIEKRWKPPKKDGEDSDSDDEDFEKLRVYIYHGPSRRPDPDFIGDFDIVITSYNTLALEYGKQGMASGEETPTTAPETAPTSGDEMDVNGDTSINSRAVKPEVEAEIKAAEVADALRRSTKKKGKTCRVGATEMSPLQAINWFRVALDEAHYIKTSTTVASKAACELQADRRIALTGTPIQNRIEDVWALFRFLRLSPVDQKECFTSYIASPCKLGDQLGVARLQLVMRVCTLRRTKDSTTKDGVRILNLPPRKEVQLWLDLRDDERKVYDERAIALKERVGDLKARNELSKNYANVLQEILRLRQICNHVDLAKGGAVEEDYDGTVMDYEVAVQGIERYGLNQSRAVSVVAFLKDGDGAMCSYCTFDFGDYFPSLGLLGGPEAAGDVKTEQKCGKAPKKLPCKPVLTKCLHLFCAGCFRAQVFTDWGKKVKETTGRECSACARILRIPDDAIDVLPPDPNGDTAEQDPQPKARAARRKYVRAPGEKPNLSTKMQYLHDELLKLSRKNPDSPHYDPFSLDLDFEELDKDGKPFVTKSVVFSQWTTMLDRIGDMLDEANIKYARLDGTMTREDRAKACDSLKSDKHTEVLLVSTRAGGVGLNLTAASRCYLVDPYWNPSVESQAIDRIHRMGQTRPVTAVKLMINDSIEMKLDAIQKKKANLAQMSLKQMSRKELMEQKAEELASLFS